MVSEVRERRLIFASLRALLDWRLIGLFATASIAFGFVTSLTRSFGLLDVNIPREFSNLLFSAGIAGIVTSFFMLIAERLNLIPRAASSLAVDARVAETAVSNLEEAVSALDKRISQIDTPNYFGNTLSKSELEAIARNFFENESFEYLEQAVGAKYGDSVGVHNKIDPVKGVYAEAVNEINKQLVNQRLNSNLNLYLGLLFATGGIAFLAYVYFTIYAVAPKPSDNIDLKVFVMGLLPRVTFVVLVESVAFFFLSLYREDRNMIRYFRNEVTNLESKFIALETAARFSDMKSLSKIIDVFGRTERNFTVKKGDRLAVELLREEDDKMFSRLVERISNNFDLTKIRKGGSGPN